MNGQPSSGVNPLESASSTEAATYQRLRAHLAALKLTAAAEALTAVLDAARAEDLTPVATLERLLGAEVTAAAARRHAGLLRLAALPAPYTLADFDFTAQPGTSSSTSSPASSSRLRPGTQSPHRAASTDALTAANPWRSSASSSPPTPPSFTSRSRP